MIILAFPILFALACLLSRRDERGLTAPPNRDIWGAAGDLPSRFPNKNIWG